MAATTWVYKHGEVGKTLTGTLSDGAGAIDLGNYTVTMTAKRSLTADPVIDDAPVDQPGGTGAISHTVTIDECDPSLVPANHQGYLLEFKLTHNNGSIRFIPENRSAARSYGRLIVQKSLE
jgi:hypothetical protein